MTNLRFERLSRRHAVALMGSAALIPGAATAQPASPAHAEHKSAADRAFENVSRHWLDQSMRFSPINATQIGDHRFDPQHRRCERARARDVQRFAHQTRCMRWSGSIRNQLSRANQVDAALLTNALRSGIWSQDVMQGWAWNPLYYQGLTGDALYGLMAREFAPLAARLDAATRAHGAVARRVLPQARR